MRHADGRAPTAPDDRPVTVADEHARAWSPRTVRHVEQGRDVPVYVTSRQCRPAGRPRGPMVVSMRPVPPGHLSAAIRESGLPPAVHGGPVHRGGPSAPDIDGRGRPDFGDAVDVGTDDVAVLRACGVTPRAAVMASRPPFAVTHAPGRMFPGGARGEQFRVARQRCPARAGGTMDP